MDMGVSIDPKEIRRINIMKYRVAPSWNLVEKVVERSKLVRLARFEIAFGIPKDTLTWYKNGFKNLPAKYWHIFYDFDLVNQIYSKIQKKSKPAEKHSLLHSNNHLLDAQRNYI